MTSSGLGLQSRRVSPIEFGYRPTLLTPRLSGTLDHVRWLAALAVCCSHLRTLLFPDYTSGGIGLKLFYFVTLFGNEAVVLFFVTSGLLVGGLIVKGVDRDRFDPRGYAADRAARLYVVLIPAIVLSEALRLLGLSVTCDQPDGLARVAANLVFLQNFSDVPICNNHPLWSLSSEAFFYLIGPGLVIAVLRRSPLAAALTAGLLAIGLFYWSDSYTTPVFGLALWLFGLAPWFVRVRIRPWIGALPLVAMLLLSRSHHVPNESVNDLGLALTFALWLCCLFDSRPVPLRRSGAILAGFSYSLYLVHMPLAQAIASVVARPLLPTSSRSYLVYAVSLATIVAVAALFGKAFEDRTHALRGRLRKWMGA